MRIYIYIYICVCVCSFRLNIFCNADRKRKLPESEKLVPVITRSSSEDHTYSCITSLKLGR